MCRRFLADSEDFSEEKVAGAGIERRFRNEELAGCLDEVRDYIRNYIQGPSDIEGGVLQTEVILKEDKEYLNHLRGRKAAYGNQGGEGQSAGTGRTGTKRTAYRRQF